MDTGRGDEALNRIGSTLMSNIRITDMVARYGGRRICRHTQKCLGRGSKKIGDKIRGKYS